ncbi:signal peptidase I [Peterkaempfera sp. SMS 1(5)a]|uniref:signal peptidase I n=1 Tax=Peterkaempfera podocarpi TaxID=3232308 RepID=UPI00366F31D0
MPGATEDRTWAPPPGVLPGPGRPTPRGLWVCLAVVLVGVLAAAAGMALYVHGYRTFTVSSAAMRPTLQPGDKVTVRRIGAGELHRGDVVVIAVPDWMERAVVVERVVGLGGDRITVGRDGALTVDGKAVQEPYLKPGGGSGERPFSAVVPSGRVFLMGDNRNDAFDSRYHLDEQQGSVSTAGLRGRVERVRSGSGDRYLTPTLAFAKVGDGRVAQEDPVQYLLLVVVGGGLALAGLIATPVTLRVSRRRARLRTTEG